MTDPTRTDDDRRDEQATDRLAALRAALYVLSASIVALLGALGLLAPDVTPRILDVVGAALTVVMLAVATWTNPAVRRARSGRHAA